MLVQYVLKQRINVLNSEFRFPDSAFVSHMSNEWMKINFSHIYEDDAK